MVILLKTVNPEDLEEPHNLMIVVMIETTLTLNICPSWLNLERDLPRLHQGIVEDLCPPLQVVVDPMLHLSLLWDLKEEGIGVIVLALVGVVGIVVAHLVEDPLALHKISGIKAQEVEEDLQTRIGEVHLVVPLVPLPNREVVVLEDGEAINHHHSINKVDGAMVDQVHQVLRVLLGLLVLLAVEATQVGLTEDLLIGVPLTHSRVVAGAVVLCQEGLVQCHLHQEECRLQDSGAHQEEVDHQVEAEEGGVGALQVEQVVVLSVAS